MKVVTSEQMRKIERTATDEIGLPTILMMENAAAQVAQHCLFFLQGIARPKVVIAAGTGNNGGDGFAIARHLHLRGVETCVILVGDSSAARGDTLLNLEITRKLGITIKTIPMGDNLLDVPYAIETCDLVVDALFGTGLNRNTEGSYEYIIEMINDYAKHVVAVDIPSGIHSDTGQVMGTAVRADETVTLGFAKIGLLLHPGTVYAGKLSVADISVPYSLLGHTDIETEVLTDEEAPDLLPERKPRAHKGSFGRVFVFAGSAGMPGAAAISCGAAYKSGAGLVYACVSPSVARMIQASYKEVIAHLLPERGSAFSKRALDAALETNAKGDVVIIGPGLGHGPTISESVFYLLEKLDAPMVLDADALNAISEDVNVLKRIKRNNMSVITPHPGEMSRLTGLPVREILENMIRVAVEFSREFDVVTVLKDARVVVASPTGHTYINATGSNALSKGGSGDALTGVIAGFMAQGLDAFTAAKLGAYIHGKAGDIAAQTLSHFGVMATDVVEKIPSVLLAFENKKNHAY